MWISVKTSILNGSHWRVWTGSGLIYSWFAFYSSNLPTILKFSEGARAEGRNSQEAILLQQSRWDMVGSDQSRTTAGGEQSHSGHHPKVASAEFADRLDVGYKWRGRLGILTTATGGLRLPSGEVGNCGRSVFFRCDSQLYCLPVFTPCVFFPFQCRGDL